MSGKPWTPREMAILHKNYTTASRREIVRLLPRHSLAAIGAQASKHGLKKEPRLRDKDVISLHRLGLSDLRISRQLGVHQTTISNRRRKLGLEANYQPGEKSPHGLEAIRSLAIKRRNPREERPLRLPKGDGAVIALNLYKADEEEFLKAIMAFRNKRRRPPTMIEAFRLAKSLGWEKNL